jgi:hypothetical protein
LCNLGEIKQEDNMKRIVIVLFAIISVPLFSMEMGSVRILKNPDSQKSKPLIAYHQSKPSFIQRYEALKKRGAIFYNDEIASVFQGINIVVANQISSLLCEDE